MMDNNDPGSGDDVSEHNILPPVEINKEYKSDHQSKFDQ